MAKEDLTEVIVVLDRSGSMGSVKSDMEGGFDAFIEEQKKEPGECKVTLVQFNTNYEAVYEAKPLAEVPKLELTPSGGTALLDAVGKTIAAAGLRLSTTSEDARPAKVVFVIITDGEENSSQEYNAFKVRNMVKHQTEKYSWQFVYLGANQDSFKVAGNLGIGMASNFVADAQGTSDLYKGVSRGVSNTRRGGNYQP